jgi:hypothetical protein
MLVTANTGTMMDRTQIAMTTRDRFAQEAEKEMTKFERQEGEFRRNDREERAAALRIPVMWGKAR